MNLFGKIGKKNNNKMIFNLYNNFGNGDVHFSRFIIKTIRNLFPESEINYLHRHKKGILKDFVFLTEKNLDENCIQNNTVKKFEETYYINTWYGQGNLVSFNQGGGTTLKTISIITNNILSSLNKEFYFHDEEVYPTIDFENIIKPEVKDGFNVLICNNNSESGQAFNMNLDYTIDTLSQKYPNINFYITEKTNIIKSNVIYTTDLIDSTPNLVEIAYISTKCQIIVGRASGPYSFSIIQNNIGDKTKSIVALCYSRIVGIWDNKFFKCKYFHIPSINILDITNNLDSIIKSYH